MNKIELNEEQIERICEAIAEVYINYRYDQNVECIYFAPYTNYKLGFIEKNKINNVEVNAIEITVVTKDNSTENEKKYEKSFNRKHKTKKHLRENNTIIKVVLDESRYYSPFGLHNSERRRGKDLLDSHILLDKTGEYEKIKKIVKEHNAAGNFASYENIAEIIPPIDNKLDKDIEIKQGEVETEAVKEFAKTPLFEYIKELK